MIEIAIAVEIPYQLYNVDLFSNRIQEVAHRAITEKRLGTIILSSFG